ncbi:uncharacterized protein LOC128173472 isoform X2 [Crassostrea angulata]|uniref:uncharacterized protein LOC128173472 isoform X2 n=1 Tax=Magallana angulata TaxID=2784310 RepID=UPI0022B1DE90|nr:uncharacterized protein LOC128173472 isoform X2 [Crassostrea angulata]
MDQLKKFGFMIKEAVGLLQLSRTQSAPSVVGRVEEDHEKKKKYLHQEHSSSCGDLILMSRGIPKDCLESSKGARKLFKKIRSQTGVFSPEEKVNFEKRKQSLKNDSNPNVSKTDDPEESVETTKGSRMSSLFSSRTGVYSICKSESFEKRKQSRFMRLKSKVSVGECSEGSFEFETETGVPELTFFTSYTKSEEVSETNPPPKNEYSLESLKTRQAEEFKTAQTKFHSMAENVELFFDESLKQVLTFGESLREEEGDLVKHPKSKTVAVTERDLEKESRSCAQYIYYNAKYFQHFYYIYNLTRDCHDRKEGLRKTNNRANLMAEDIVIKIGIVGESTEDKLCSLLKRRGIKETPSQNQQIWKQSPIICFQESPKSTIEMLRREKACHKILIISDPNHKETEKIEDSIFIIREDKEDILRMISICLEEQIHYILQDWLSNMSKEDFGKHIPWIIDEIKDIRKEMFDESICHTTGSVNESIVPPNVIKYLFGRPDVNSFGIWRNSSFKVFVKKTIDVKELEHALKNLQQLFFENYNLEIVKGRLVALEALKQGGSLLRKDGESFVGTLGGFVTKRDDEKKIYALTCNHVFPKEELLAYTDNCTDRDIGTCVFTIRDSSCDFAAIEINESFSSKCDVALRREDNKEISAKVYNESLATINFVHKIGATTNATKGRIISSEYYNKALPKNTFLVKGTGKRFSKPGDSGSLVLSIPRTGRQNFINVFGMVFADNFEFREDDNDSDNNQHLERNKDSEGTQNRDAEKVEANVDKTTSSNAPTSSVGDDDKNKEILSCCYRIHPAFDLFKEERGVDVKFRDDLPTPTSSPDDSYEETN